MTSSSTCVYTEHDVHVHQPLSMIHVALQYHVPQNLIHVNINFVDQTIMLSSRKPMLTTVAAQSL